MWFEQLRFFITGKELEFTIDQTLAEYVTIMNLSPFPSYTNTEALNTPTSDISHGFTKLSIKTEKPTTTLNIEKAVKYKAASVKIMFIINNYIDELDREFVRSYNNTKG